MTAYGGFKYELDKTYFINGDEIKLCTKGFHFCLTQKDVYNYHPPDFNTRYFKVKGLVKRTDYEVYGHEQYNGFFLTSVDKIVAKQITLIEEIPMSKMDGAQALFEERYPFIKEMDPIPETKEEYEARVREICNQKLCKSYSETFIFLMLGSDYNYKIYIKMKALADEGISPDMRAYLLLMTEGKSDYEQWLQSGICEIC
jgi:hypothetical protein